MREIKFRAWNKEKEEMDNNPVHMGTATCAIGINQLPRMFESKGVVLMQYTGLKDKGGQDWYEGDILENDREWWQIVWDKEQAQWQCQPITKGTCWIDLAELANVQDTNHCGNIYENPELL